MQQPEVLTDTDLTTWDWRADLKADERGIPWLARRTGRAASTVYKYAYGLRPVPIAWLRDVARVLGKDIAA